MKFKSCLLIAFAILTTMTFTNDAQAMLNPTLGRFMQRDSYQHNRVGGGYQDGMNRYAYYAGMEGGVDPTGEKIEINNIKFTNLNPYNKFDNAGGFRKYSSKLKATWKVNTTGGDDVEYYTHSNLTYRIQNVASGNTVKPKTDWDFYFDGIDKGYMSFDIINSGRYSSRSEFESDIGAEPRARNYPRRRKDPKYIEDIANWMQKKRGWYAKHFTAAGTRGHVLHTVEYKEYCKGTGDSKLFKKPTKGLGFGHKTNEFGHKTNGITGQPGWNSIGMTINKNYRTTAPHFWRDQPKDWAILTIRVEWEWVSWKSAYTAKFVYDVQYPYENSRNTSGNQLFKYSKPTQ